MCVGVCMCVGVYVCMCVHARMHGSMQVIKNGGKEIGKEENMKRGREGGTREGGMEGGNKEEGWRTSYSASYARKVHSLGVTGGDRGVVPCQQVCHGSPLQA